MPSNAILRTQCPTLFDKWPRIFDMPMQSHRHDTDIPRPLITESWSTGGKVNVISFQVWRRHPKPCQFTDQYANHQTTETPHTKLEPRKGHNKSTARCLNPGNSKYYTRRKLKGVYRNDPLFYFQHILLFSWGSGAFKLYRQNKFVAALRRPTDAQSILESNSIFWHAPQSRSVHRQWWNPPSAPRPNAEAMRIVCAHQLGAPLLHDRRPALIEATGAGGLARHAMQK